MCYPKPGPRCSGHVREEFKKAIADRDKNPTPETEARVELLREAFKRTPAGIRALRESARLNSDDPSEMVQVFQMADHYEQERRTRIAAYNLLSGNEGGVSKFAERAIAETEVPASNKRFWFLSDSSVAKYADDDPVGESVNYIPEVDGYRGDLAYELDHATGNLIVEASWQVSDPSSATGAMNFYEVNDLEEDHRPTDEEADEIARSLNDEFNNNLNDGPDTSLTDWEAEQKHRTAESILDAHSFDFDGGVDLREQMSDRIKDSTVFKHTVGQFRGFDGGYVQETWDSLYGEND